MFSRFFSPPSPPFYRDVIRSIFSNLFFFFSFTVYLSFTGMIRIFNFRCVSKPRNNYSKIGRNFFFLSCFALLPQTKVSRFNQNFVVPALAISYLALNIHKLKFVTRRKEGFYVSPLCRGVTPKIEIQ